MSLRRYLSLSALSCVAVLLIGGLTPSFSQQVPVTPIPPDVQQLISTCLPPNSTYEYVNAATDATGTYHEITVSPILAPATPESTETPAVVDETTQFESLNPWRLVVLSSGEGCQALTTPTTTEAEVNQQIPNAPRRKLALGKMKQLLDSIGVDKLLGLITGKDDPNHGSDLPSDPSISADTAWSLRELGVPLPAGVKVRP